MASKVPVKVTASRSKGKAAKGKLRHIIITPGKNGGHTVEHHFHPPESSGKSNPMAYMPPPEPEQYPFSDKADTMQHLDSALGGPSVMPQQTASSDTGAGGDDEDAGDEQAA
jgi:hypothetical protein